MWIWRMVDLGRTWYLLHVCPHFPFFRRKPETCTGTRIRQAQTMRCSLDPGIRYWLLFAVLCVTVTEWEPQETQLIPVVMYWSSRWQRILGLWYWRLWVRYLWTKSHYSCPCMFFGYQDQHFGVLASQIKPRETRVWETSWISLVFYSKYFCPPHPAFQMPVNSHVLHSLGSLQYKLACMGCRSAGLVIHRRGTSPTKKCKLQLGDPGSAANCVLLLLRKDINSSSFSMLWWSISALY